MKKLSKINFKDASLLNENEMKHVFGGSGSTSEGGTTSCSTTCGSGAESIEITGCNGTCTSIDGVSVSCSGAKNVITKNC